MGYLKNIVIIVFSSLAGASISAIITILSARKDSKRYGNLLYRARFWTLIFLELIMLLIFLLSVIKD
jgi:hypothetical protein